MMHATDFRPSRLYYLAIVGLLIWNCLACDSPTQPAGITQPLRGTITLENQEDHSWITISLSRMDSNTEALITVIAFTKPDGSYSLPILEDGTWSMSAFFPYYAELKDTIQVTDGNVTGFIGTQALTQALQLQAITNRPSYAPEDTVFILLITRNLTEQPVTLQLVAAPAQYHVIRQSGQTTAHSSALNPVVSTRTFTPGVSDTASVPWWIPGGPDQASVSPGTYSVFALWGPPNPCDASEPDYFGSPPECSQAAEALLRTVIPTSITITDSAQIP